MTEVAVVTVLFGAPVVGVVLIAYFFTRLIRQRNELKAELYSKALEKGVELPPDLFGNRKLFGSEKKPKNPQRSFNAGVILLAAGVSFALAFAIAGLITCQKEPFVAAAFGVIPALLGVACFVFYAVGKKRQHGQA